MSSSSRPPSSPDDDSRLLLLAEESLSSGSETNEICSWNIKLAQQGFKRFSTTKMVLIPCCFWRRIGLFIIPYNDIFSKLFSPLCAVTIINFQLSFFT